MYLCDKCGNDLIKNGQHPSLKKTWGNIPIPNKYGKCFICGNNVNLMSYPALRDDYKDKTMDNWQHRSENMLCKTCMYFVLKKSKLGRCRRHAPTIKGYPAVFECDWCGDHKIDENKLTIS